MYRTRRPAVPSVALLAALLSLSAVATSARSGGHPPTSRHIRMSHGTQRAPRTRIGRATSLRSSVASRSGFLVGREALEALREAPKAILVVKSRKTLTLMENGAPVKTYPVAIGRRETGAKQSAGDWRTPEGLYYVAAHNPASRFHLALRISYPNARDAERGLSDGLIKPAQADAIRAAVSSGGLPPQNTRLGYDVEIHGGYHLAATPAGEPLRIRSYTRGCVAVTNDMIREIYQWAPDGAPILIAP